ncbi:polysaccharide deacetylase [Chthoniobacter flavus Ellin428]|uniref:Polysaccharide deacetylase n=1 Tax=Chthoniobacter flavus Ellin428 TaxID=497964 RepID=B4CTT1_9BACT|nr:polysaccharide deacetylase family protein [Chthoniobacter flavus]EDY21969.1 polysaccharide deacetylase [Chthoniobacter flavus Ellin428]TCO89357.1 polysaccharide deacetylase [Chthoniobacter flavus]
MTAELPRYYLRLGHLAPLFAEGLPVLTYHKVARPKWRLGGSGALLYVSPRLFAEQVAELHTAGFRSGGIDEALRMERNGDRKVVLTFDDGFENLHAHAMEPMASHGFQGITYLIADRLGGINEWEIPLGCARERLMDVVQTREWLAAGNKIGAHTLTHPHLTQLDASAAREEITASKKKLEDIFGQRIDHFCYPYGDYNERVCDMVAEAGFLTATITKRGLNNKATPPMALRRFMVRYPKWELRDWWRLWTGR